VSLVDSLLFRPLPVTSPDTLVDIFTSSGDGDESATSSYQDCLDIKALLAGIGLYGVIAFSVARHTREIGVRMALGAKPGMVLSMVMRQGFTIVAIGMVAGGFLAGAAASALRGVLYGVTPFDPVAWGLALSAMLVAAALANFVPASRAMRIDPMSALRTE